MSKFNRTMYMGFGLLAAVVAAPAYADAQAGSAASSVTRVQRVGTRMETIVVLGGAVDPQGKRWDDSGAKNAVLPTVSESAFLDGDEAASVEAPQS